MSFDDACVLDEHLLLDSLVALRRGDFSARLPRGWSGRAGRIAAAFNELAELNEQPRSLLHRSGFDVLLDDGAIVPTLADALRRAAASVADTPAAGATTA